MRDAEQPAGQAARDVEAPEVAECLDEGLLCELLRNAAVSDHPHDEADHRALVAPHDLLERGLRAAERLRHEAGLGNGLEINRDWLHPCEAYEKYGQRVAERGGGSVRAGGSRMRSEGILC